MVFTNKCYHHVQNDEVKRITRQPHVLSKHGVSPCSDTVHECQT